MMIHNSNGRHWLLAALSLLASLSFVQAKAASGERPNILFIIADDQSPFEIPKTNEGISFTPVLEGQQDMVRDVLFGVYCGGAKPGMRCVRKGDWKLIKYESIKNNTHHTQLFNLAENPHEFLKQHHDPEIVDKIGVRPTDQQVNLAGDPRYAEQQASMESLLLREMRRLDDPHRFWDQPDDQLPPVKD